MSRRVMSTARMVEYASMMGTPASSAEVGFKPHLYINILSYSRGFHKKNYAPGVVLPRFSLVQFIMVFRELGTEL